MHRKTGLSLIVASILMVALFTIFGTQQTFSQSPTDAGAGTDLATTASTGISYQGVLREDDALVTGSRTMTFTLHSDAGCATQVAETAAAVDVYNGVFAANPDFGVAPFNGQALWLQVQVGGATLPGCTEITPAPYTLGLLPGAETRSDGATSIFRAINDKTDGRTRGLYAKAYSTVTDTAAVYGHAGAATGEVYGVYGKSDSTGQGAAGVYGVSTAESGQNYGVYGWVNNPDGRAIQAINEAETGKTRAVYAKIYSSGEDAAAVYGHAGATEGETFGIYGKNDSMGDGAAGVYGVSTAGSGKTYGIYGWVDNPDGRAVQAINEAETGKTRAVYAKIYSSGEDAAAVYGHAGATEGETFGVYGKNDSGSQGSAGVYGVSTHEGENKVYGVYGWVNAANGRAIQAMNEATSGQARAVYAKSMSTAGQAVYAHAGATSGENYGLYAKSDSPDGSAVYGHATASSGENYGVWGVTDSPNGWAGYFEGDTKVVGDLVVSGTLSANVKNFRMQHPLDSDKVLIHASVEAPEMVNLYSGNSVLDEDGRAIVTLPDYFQALNTDLRYSLTPIGAPAPGLYIAEEVMNNQFVIAGGGTGQKISWQITGVRQDDWALQNPMQVVSAK